MRLAHVNRGLSQKGSVFGDQLLCQMGPEPFGGRQLARGLQQQPRLKQRCLCQRRCAPVLFRGRARKACIERQIAPLCRKQTVERGLELRALGIGFGRALGIAHCLIRPANSRRALG